jgi:hypothetical protein
MVYGSDQLEDEYSPVASSLDSPLSTAGKSSDDVGEASGSVRMSVACADAMARSRGTLGRPRKGMLSEKRLVDGFKEDIF